MNANTNPQEFDPPQPPLHLFSSTPTHKNPVTDSQVDSIGECCATE